MLFSLTAIIKLLDRYIFVVYLSSSIVINFSKFPNEDKTLYHHFNFMKILIKWVVRVSIYTLFKYVYLCFVRCLYSVTSDSVFDTWSSTIQSYKSYTILIRQRQRTILLFSHARNPKCVHFVRVILFRGGESSAERKIDFSR